MTSSNADSDGGVFWISCGITVNTLPRAASSTATNANDAVMETSMDAAGRSGTHLRWHLRAPCRTNQAPWHDRPGLPRPPRNPGPSPKAQTPWGPRRPTPKRAGDAVHSRLEHRSTSPKSRQVSFLRENFFSSRMTTFLCANRRTRGSGHEPLPPVAAAPWSNASRRRRSRRVSHAVREVGKFRACVSRW